MKIVVQLEITLERKFSVLLPLFLERVSTFCSEWNVRMRKERKSR